MGNGDGSKKISATSEMENLSLGISTNRISRDLLRSFMGSNSEYEAVKEEGEEIELNLGLSLGGRFGVDRSSTKLVRSSSIASVLPVVRDDNDALVLPPATYTGLMRTSSLPVETEEEWRKRKELQTLRRMEAKKRRSEKQRISKGDKEGGGSRGGGGGGSLSSSEEKKEIEVNLKGRLDREKSLSAIGSKIGVSAWAASQPLSPCGTDVAMAKGKGSYGSSSGGIQAFGFMKSEAINFSGFSNLDKRTIQGTSRELSPTGILSLQEGSNLNIGSSAIQRRESTSRAITSERDSSLKRPGNRSTSSENMPCVFTKGDGPNGRRVDGILYKYGKGEEVRIMCVCHGNFHSPAEFIKHAGGTNVEHPLKHIVVNPNASSFL